MNIAYKLIEDRLIDSSLLLVWYFKAINKDIARKLSLRQKAFNPWCVSFSEKIQVDVFSLIYEVLSYFTPKIGYEITETWYKNGDIKRVALTLTKIGVFIYHLKKLSGEDKLHQVFVKKV